MSWLRELVQLATASWMRIAIKVKIGGKTVEVCCDECSQRLKEAHVSAAGTRRG